MNAYESARQKIIASTDYQALLKNYQKIYPNGQHTDYIPNIKFLQKALVAHIDHKERLSRVGQYKQKLPYDPLSPQMVKLVGDYDDAIRRLRTYKKKDLKQKLNGDLIGDPDSYDKEDLRKIYRAKIEQVYASEKRKLRGTPLKPAGPSTIDQYFEFPGLPAELNVMIHEFVLAAKPPRHAGIDQVLDDIRQGRYRLTRTCITRNIHAGYRKECQGYLNEKNYRAYIKFTNYSGEHSTSHEKYAEFLRSGQRG
jgi:hypothetical protein